MCPREFILLSIEAIHSDIFILFFFSNYEYGVKKAKEEMPFELKFQHVSQRNAEDEYFHFSKLKFLTNDASREFISARDHFTAVCPDFLF